MTLRRRLALALLVLMVALVHRWLLAPPDAQPGQRSAAAQEPLATMQVRQVQADSRTPAAPAAKPAAPRTAAIAQRQEVRAPRPAAAEPVAAKRDVPAPATGPAAITTASRAVTAQAEPADPANSATATATAAPQGQPLPPAPPPTQAVRLRYRVTRGDAVGEGTLVYTPDAEGGYVLTLHAQVPGMSEIDWQSSGRVTPAGLAPLRLVERKRGRATRAVNFQRDKGLISYSGPTRTDVLRPGAQDRLSLLLHLPALVRAQPMQSEWALQVAAPGGSADTWRVAVRTEPDATVLTREPERPYDWRLEWTLTPTAPQWPRRMVWTLLPGGQPIEWSALPGS